MHGPIVTTLTENPILTLFIVIGLGYLLGEISFFGFRFGIVGVLFVGLAVGSLGPSISVPEVIPTLGLIIFIYTIGIQSGPEFFKSLRERGYRDNYVRHPRFTRSARASARAFALTNPMPGKQTRQTVELSRPEGNCGQSNEGDQQLVRGLLQLRSCCCGCLLRDA